VLGAEFLEMVKGFIYAGSLGQEGLKNILDMKRKIDEKAAAQRRGGRNVKLGPGGIREIELVAQSLQASHGDRVPEVRERNTLHALRALWSHALLSDEEYDALTKAYIFLRDVENKLQMVQDAQTHWLPVADDELLACAILLGYGTPQAEGSPVDRFERDYRQHTTQVSRIFESVLGAASLRRFTR
jgi:glutamate-ammonia-ligase adenylyltransferase